MLVDLPSLLIKRFTVSITSTKASFLRYFTSALRQEVAPVAWIVIFDESSRCQKILLACSCHGAPRLAYDSHLRLDAFGCNVHLQCINLRILRVAKVEDFCQGDPKDRQSALGWILVD